MERELKLHTEVVIDAAHFLRGYQGVCSQLHGHSWKVRIWIKGNADQVDDLGILFDFTNVRLIKDIYDHRCFNDIEPFNRINPTAENISLEVYRVLKLVKPDLRFVVRVYETSIGKETWCQTGGWDESS